MKTTVTLGLINDKHVVLKDPSIEVDDHIKFIRQLTSKGGKIESGKTFKQVQEAIVVHSVKGMLKRRSFA